MKYAAITCFAALSTVLLAATCFLWVRSYTMTDDVYWYSEARMTRYRTSGGGFWFETRPKQNEKPRFNWQKFPDKALYPFRPSDDSPWYEKLGFNTSTQGYDLLLVMPYWSVAAILLPLPVLWQWVWRRRRRRRRRLRKGLCIHCGYDLRSSTGACPECGRAKKD